MNKTKYTIFALACLTAMPMAFAHHGFSAHFDPDKLIRIEGTVTKFDFINPHGFLFIESVDESGQRVEYVCDLQARTQLMRRGVDETLFTTGEHIVVEGYQARRDPLGCEFGVAYFDDGNTFTMRSTDQARTQFAQNKRTPVADGDDRTIFGTWIRPGMFGDASGRGPLTGDDSITTAGKAAVAAFDPITENPVIECRGGSPVRNWRPPGLATAIRQEEGKIYIYHESMDITRTVHMDLTEHPQDVEPDEMGHSIGRFDGNTLIIDTSALTAGVLFGSIVNTDQMTLQERLSIVADTGDLLIDWTVYEPAYYAEPLSGTQTLQSTEQEIIRYECIPGSPMGDQSY
jgi:hypothetical protein